MFKNKMERECLSEKETKKQNPPEAGHLWNNLSSGILTFDFQLSSWRLFFAYAVVYHFLESFEWLFCTTFKREGVYFYIAAPRSWFCMRRQCVCSEFSKIIWNKQGSERLSWNLFWETMLGVRPFHIPPQFTESVSHILFFLVKSLFRPVPRHVMRKKMHGCNYKYLETASVTETEAAGRNWSHRIFLGDIPCVGIECEVSTTN